MIWILCSVYGWFGVASPWLYVDTIFCQCVGLLLVHVWFILGLIRIGLVWIQFLVYCFGLCSVCVKFSFGFHLVYGMCVFGLRLVSMWFVFGSCLV